MSRQVRLVVGIAALAFASISAQTPVVTGDHTTPLRPVAGDGNVGISNAVLRNQDDVRALRVVIEPGGKRVLHAHTDVKFHLFIPISGPMTVDLADGQTVAVPAWQPYYMKGGTQHGFHNPGTAAVEVMEVFIK